MGVKRHARMDVYFQNISSRPAMTAGRGLKGIRISPASHDAARPPLMPTWMVRIEWCAAHLGDGRGGGNPSRIGGGR